MKGMLRLFYFYNLLLLMMYGQDYVSNMQGPWGMIPAIMAIVLLGYSVWNPFHKLIKFCSLISIMAFFSFYFANGKVDHNLHAILLSSIFLCFIDGKNLKRDELTYQCAISVLMFTYFLAGLWKLRFAFADGLEGILAFQLANNMVINGFENKWALMLLKAPSSMQSLLWMMLIIFELAGFLITLKGNWIRVWGILLCLFHTLIYIVMDVPFFEVQVVILILMVLGPKAKLLVKA